MDWKRWKERDHMLKRIVLLIVIGVITMAVAGQAQGASTSVWQASYWNNRYQSQRANPTV
jgi:hypothetical protein